MRFGRALGDTVILETVFNITGLGTFLIDGIKLRDYDVVQGCVIFIAFMFSVIMLIVVPPQTIQTALYMNFANFDIFGIFKALQCKQTVVVGGG